MYYIILLCNLSLYLYLYLSFSISLYIFPQTCDQAQDMKMYFMQPSVKEHLLYAPALAKGDITMQSLVNSQRSTG